MARYERFTFYCDKVERNTIAKLAEYFQRSQSDAVRFVLREKALELALIPESKLNQEKATDKNVI